MPDDKKKDDVVEEEDDFEIELEDDDDLGEDEDDDDLEVDIEEENEKAEREEKERNKAFASMRIENKELKERQAALEAQVQGMSARPTPKQDAQVSDGIPRTDAEWDALADKDWKKAVDLRSNMNAQHVIATNNQVIQSTQTLEKNKARVIERHPELNDNSSEKSRIFLNILATNPDYVNHPNGPIYAMRDMEDHMETVLGYKRSDIVTAEKQGAQRESQRQHRIVLNKGSGKTPGGSGHTVTLTKDESEFCKIQGIDPKEYAKTKKRLSKSGKEGMTV